MKKCEGTSAFSEENPRDRRKKPAGDGDGTCPTEPWSEILLSLWYSVEAGTGERWLSKGAAKFTTAGSLWKLAIHS